MARRPGPDLGERDLLAVRPALEQDREAVHRAPDGGPGPVVGLAELPGPLGRRPQQRDVRRERRVRDLARLGQQQLVDPAAEDRADDVQLVEPDRVRAAGPQARHLPGADHHAAGGEHLLQLAGLPDAAVGGGQPEVPLHGASPFQRSAARCWPATQASSTWVACTWTYRTVVPVQECPSSSWMANRVIPDW